MMWTFEIPASCRRQALELSREKVAMTFCPYAARSIARLPFGGAR